MQEKKEKKKIPEPVNHENGWRSFQHISDFDPISDVVTEVIPEKIVYKALTNLDPYSV